MADAKKAIEDFRNGGKTADDIRAQIAALQAELEQREEAERKAAMAGDAKRGIALLAAMREAYKQIQELFPETFADEKYAVLATGQAWPRDVKIRRIADLSETEAANARERGKDAVAKLK